MRGSTRPRGKTKLKVKSGAQGRGIQIARPTRRRSGAARCMHGRAGRAPGGGHGRATAAVCPPPHHRPSLVSVSFSYTSARPRCVAGSRSVGGLNPAIAIGQPLRGGGVATTTPRFFGDGLHRFLVLLRLHRLQRGDARGLPGLPTTACEPKFPESEGDGGTSIHWPGWVGLESELLHGGHGQIVDGIADGATAGHWPFRGAGSP